MSRTITMPLFALALLAGCSQPPATVDIKQPSARATSVSAPPAAIEQCAKADWQSTGYRHGLSGYPLTALNTLIETCADTGAKVDRLAYSTGRLKGLTRFCTADNGFRRAQAGHPVANPCPPSLADAYEQGHAAGAMRK
jgi:hypothetical protein